MKPLDDELRSLLKRREPPEGFAERVLERIETSLPQRPSAGRTAGLWRRPVLRWVAVAAACVLVLAAVARHKQQRERAQAEQAGRQAIWALTVASNELNSALEQAQRVTVQALTAPQKTKTRME
jgi:hypothetical protein